MYRLKQTAKRGSDRIGGIYLSNRYKESSSEYFREAGASYEDSRIKERYPQIH